jgi:transcriptional regulator GlxA family with amidase domain
MNIKIPVSFALLNCIAVLATAQQNSLDSLAARHQRMMDIIMTKPKYPVKTIGIYLYDGYQTLDAMGPYETLANLSGVHTFYVAKKKGLVRNQRGMGVQVDTSIEKVEHLDILVIPGGAAETYMQTKDTAVLNWIRKIDKGSTFTTSVCTGAWILGATGLLQGKKATTNWYRAEEMLKSYGATFQHARYVQDGKYWTSAGVTAGIDMSLAIINDLMGEKFTQSVMLNLEYDPHPPIIGGAPEKSDPLVRDMMLEMYDMGLQPLMKKK